MSDGDKAQVPDHIIHKRVAGQRCLQGFGKARRFRIPGLAGVVE